MGNPGWSWEEMLPFFKASETFHPAQWYQSDLNICGTDGRLHITINPLAPIFEKILESFIDSGFDYKPSLEKVLSSGYPCTEKALAGYLIWVLRKFSVIILM
jgi:choline dehydrogenase-like flavoprotein